MRKISRVIGGIQRLNCDAFQRVPRQIIKWLAAQFFCRDVSPVFVRSHEISLICCALHGSGKTA